MKKIIICLVLLIGTGFITGLWLRGGESSQSTSVAAPSNRDSGAKQQPTPAHDHPEMARVPAYYNRRQIKFVQYGFHSTSHRYVARCRQLKNIQRDQINIIKLHLGHPCSAAAIKSGNSIDTSLGLTLSSDEVWL